MNKPLTGIELSKVVIFICLMLPIVIFGVGIIPAIFLALGVYTTKKSSDFVHIEESIKYFKWYVLLFIIGGLLSSLYFGLSYFNSDSWSDYYWYNKTEFFISFVFTLIPIAYYFLVTYLFYTPLENHKEWVAKNGIFASTIKEDTQVNPNVDIIKSDKLKAYSVADELAKWVKLKEDGHITEEEYDKARKDLLG